jgi:hypothetical protein
LLGLRAGVCRERKRPDRLAGLTQMLPDSAPSIVACSFEIE